MFAFRFTSGDSMLQAESIDMTGDYDGASMLRVFAVNDSEALGTSVESMNQTN